MLNKYVVALLALEPKLFESEAQKSFANIIDEYVAGPESYPHITLCQFYTDKENIAKIDEDLAEVKTFPQPRFNGLHFIKSYLPNLWGAELSIAREAKLVDFHKQIVAILKKHNIASYVTETGDLFRPHLTLARINRLQINHFNEELLKKCEFSLTLGEVSKIGQYKKTLTTYAAKMK